MAASNQIQAPCRKCRVRIRYQRRPSRRGRPPEVCRGQSFWQARVAILRTRTAAACRHCQGIQRCTAPTANTCSDGTCSWTAERSPRAALRRCTSLRGSKLASAAASALPAAQRRSRCRARAPSLARRCSIVLLMVDACRAWAPTTTAAAPHACNTGATGSAASSECNRAPSQRRAALALTSCSTAGLTSQAASAPTSAAAFGSCTTGATAEPTLPPA